MFKINREYSNIIYVLVKLIDKNPKTIDINPVAVTPRIDAKPKK